MKLREIQLDGASFLCTEVEGPGRPVILLHGFTGHRDDFIHRLPEMAGRAWWLAPDLRGHGDFAKTNRSETFTFHQLVADLGHLLDRLGADDCHLLGHSVGGMVALRFALAHPERVQSLILMSSAPFCPEGYTRKAFEIAGQVIEQHGMSFLQEALEKSWREDPDQDGISYTSRWSEIYWPHHRRRYLAMDPVGYAALGIAMVDQEDLRDRLGEIACPTTVIIGDGDHEFLDGSKALAGGIPGAVCIDIREAGHHPHMENPEAWRSALYAHLDRVNT